MDPITPTPITPATTPPRANDRLTAASDFKSFLTLLTAQLRNQDPLDPLDSTQFVAQLASFSTVEQLIGANERLDALTDALGGGELMQFSGWIGREVSVANGLFTANGSAVRFDVTPAAGTERIEAVVSTPEGVVQRRFTVATDGTGGVWDGRNTAGTPIVGQTLRIDLYHLRGEEIIRTDRAAVFGEVVGVTKANGNTRLLLEDGRQIDPDNVTGLREPAA